MPEVFTTLTEELATKSLKTLGYNPQILQHAFLELSIPNENLDDISIIKQFQHIMYLDLSINNLKSLSVLSSLPNLIQLNARYTGSFIQSLFSLKFVSQSKQINRGIEFFSPSLQK
jgi:hypothetical protein